MKERLKILWEHHVISDAVYDNCLRLHDDVFSKHELVGLPAYQVAMTHLAMAAQRVLGDEIVAEMEEPILSQVTQSMRFGQVSALTQEVLVGLDVDMPQSEIQYLWLHFLNLLNEKGG